MNIILVGNQNSGKTTIYNYLTKKQEKTGNWPGVTIEYKTSKIVNTNHILTDLPGIYSLSPYSKEESITTNYLLTNNYDLIINVIDINLIERSLYLTLELLDLNKTIFILLTHTSTYTQKEIIKYKKILESNLNIKVIDIKEINNQLINKKNKPINIFSKDIETLINKLSNNRYKSINIIKSNKLYTNTIQKKYQMDINELLSYQRYKYIENITNQINIHKTNNILDKILLNKILGLPIFILIMSFIYYFSIIIIGNLTSELITNITNIINNKIIIILNNLNVYKWLINLITNGIFKSISILISFIPQLLIIFILTEILNQTGYITRITYLLDGLLNKIGLSGKSIISFIVGTSCSVPAILQSRIIDNKIKRDKTIILVPFIPCSAKLPIILLISNYLKINYLIIIIYLLSIIIVIISSLILNKIFILKDNNYILELPSYQLPKLKHILKEVLNKLKEFLKRTSSLILICSIIIWILLNVSINTYDSILYLIGKKISYIFYPFLGSNNWILSVSILEGLIAREQVVTSLNIINNDLSIFSKPTLLSFLIFNMFNIPCINTIINMKNELNNIKKLLFSIFFQFIISFILSVIIYRIGTLIW